MLDPGHGPLDGGPAAVVCGTTLATTPAGPVLADASHGPVTVDAASVGGRLYLRVADGCDRGADVTVPAGAAVVVATARAEDGRPAAVVLAPARPVFDVTVGHPDGTTSVVAVRLRG